MKRNGIWTIVLVLLAGGMLLGNQDDTVVKPLTMQQAIDIALENNAEMIQSGNQLALAQLRVKQRKSNFLPSGQVNLSVAKHVGKEWNVISDGFESSNVNTVALSYGSTLNLFNGFYDTASLKQSILDLKGTENNVSRVRQQVIFDTIQRYLRVVTAENAVDVELGHLKAQQLQLERIREFCQAGKRPNTDLELQRAEVAGAEYRLVNARRNVIIEKLLFFQTIGILSTDKKQSSAPLPKNRQAVLAKYRFSLPSLKQFSGSIVRFNRKGEVAKAMYTRSDVKSSKLALMSAETGIKAAKSGYYPKVDLFAEVGTSYNSLNESAAFSDQFWNGNAYSKFGISLSVPLFNRSTTRHRVAEARINAKEREVQFKKKKEQVIVEMTQAMADYNSQVKGLSLSESRKKYSLAALKGIEARYDADAATLVELTQIRSNYLESLYESLNASFNLWVSSVALSFYKGDEAGMLDFLDKTTGEGRKKEIKEDK